MKNTISILLIVLSLCSFKNIPTINNCFLGFKGTSNLNVFETKRLPESSEKYRDVKTDKGEVRISRLDAYRILYKNEKGAPLVHMMVELSDPDSAKSDKIRLLENLDYLNKSSKRMETNSLIEKEMNGFKVYGSSRSSIDEGTIQSTFLIFTKNTIIYIYFYNTKPEYRTYADLKDYKKLRDNFINAFTKYLSTCKG